MPEEKNLSIARCGVYTLKDGARVCIVAHWLILSFPPEDMRLYEMALYPSPPPVTIKLEATEVFKLVFVEFKGPLRPVLRCVCVVGGAFFNTSSLTFGCQSALSPGNWNFPAS